MLPRPGLISSVRRDKIAARVSAALSTLAPVDQELIALTVWDGLTPTQAATAVGLSGPTRGFVCTGPGIALPINWTATMTVTVRPRARGS